MPSFGQRHTNPVGLEASSGSDRVAPTRPGPACRSRPWSPAARDRRWRRHEPGGAVRVNRTQRARVRRHGGHGGLTQEPALPGGGQTSTGPDIGLCASWDKCRSVRSPPPRRRVLRQRQRPGVTQPTTPLPPTHRAANITTPTLTPASRSHHTGATVVPSCWRTTRGYSRGCGDHGVVVLGACND